MINISNLKYLHALIFDRGLKTTKLKLKWPTLSNLERSLSCTFKFINWVAPTNPTTHIAIDGDNHYKDKPIARICGDKICM